MHTDFDYDDHDRRTLADWHADRRAHAQQRWRDRIPPAQQARHALDPRVEAWVDQLAAGTAGNLILIGPVGTGKTWHTWHAVDAAYTRGWSGAARFYSAYTWKNITSPPEVDHAEIARAVQCDLLILDDPGALRVGEWDKENLLGIADERWNHHRPTVLTSNAASLADMLGARAASRFAHGTTVVALTGPDRRSSR